MKKLLYIILILLLASPVFGAYSNINCDDADATTWCILTSDTTFDGDTDCGGACDSSDTIIIEGGARANLLLRDLDGSGSYITITNEDITPDSRVVINENAGDGYGILSIYNCKYIDLTGNNDADLTYGIVVEGDGDGSRTGGIWVYGESDHVKIGYIEVDFSGSSETYGSGIFVQDGGLSASWTWDTFEIHHNYIHDTRYHGMYLGENQPSIDDDPWSKNFSIHDNILEDLGGNGFVYKGVATGGTELIYNNTVDNTGLVTAAGDEWKAGIRWRPYSSATVSIYNNTVFNTPGPGIIGWESQTTIYDNILAGNGTGTDGGIWRHGILIDKVGANIPDNVTIYDNIIIQPIGYGIYNNDSATAGVTLSRNLIGDAGLGEWDETNSGDTVESGSPNDNTYHADVATFNFNTWSDDSNYSNDVFRATYTYYFSDDAAGNAAGNDGNNCTTTGTACKTLTKAWALIAVANSVDTVNLYFDRGDQWDFDTGQTDTWVIQTSDPIVNIDAYGSGDKPIFDGNVTDFSAVDDHNTNGYESWNSAFLFIKQGCSVSNVEIQWVYGRGLTVTSDFTLLNTEIHHIGMSAIKSRREETCTGITVENNLIYTCQELYRNSKFSSWGGGIDLYCDNAGCYDNYDHVVKYNVVYDIYGEGIQCGGSIVEYNIIGDTGSIAIHPAPSTYNAHDTIVRHNFIVMSDISSSIYDTFSGSTYDGIVYKDENDTYGLDNSAATIEIYGNVIINRWNGLRVYNGNSTGAIRVYNNTVIDSQNNNFTIGDASEFNSGTWYNNASILYDQTDEVHVADDGSIPHANWTIEYNAYWTAGTGDPTIDADWDDYEVVTDPKLYGEPAVNWDGQTTGDPRSKIEFADIYPESDSSLIDAGKTLTYDDDFLSTGTDFSVLPATQTFTLLDQDMRGDGWEIGAAVYDSDPVTGDPITITPPGALTIVPDAGGAITITY